MKVGIVTKLSRLANKISKMPIGSSYRWDERISIVATLVFHTVAVLRILSLLQIFKYLHRKRFGRDRHFQKRTNFHSLYTEVYFILVIGLLILINLWPGPPSIVSSWIAGYFATEAILWSVYYLFFRHFIESHFTIYHHAEYFLAFPLALIVQVLGISIAMAPNCDIGLASRVTQTIGYLFNNSNFSVEDGNCTKYQQGVVSNALSVLGIFYVVVLLANLRDAFPRTQIKPATTLSIIGSGNVVSERLLGALIKPFPSERLYNNHRRQFDPVEINPDAIKIYDLSVGGLENHKWLEIELKRANGTSYKKSLPVKFELSSQNIVTELTSTRSPVIIATPSDSHFFYIAMLALHSIRFAVEKPITVFQPEINLLREQGEKLLADGFCMSYYALEKALPITYLYSMNPIHRNHLDLLAFYDNEPGMESVESLPWNEILGCLGDPVAITILLLEGMEHSPSRFEQTRQWTENPHLGGLFYETAIHGVTVLHKILGSLDRFQPRIEALVSEKAVRNDSCSFVSLSSSCNPEFNTPEITILIGKYMPEQLKARGAIIDYNQATVCCDFDDMALEIIPKDKNFSSSNISKFTIQVSEPYYSRKYATQASLIRAFFEYGWNGIRFDDYYTQISVLTWLDRNRSDFMDKQRDMRKYDVAGKSLPIMAMKAVERFKNIRPRRIRSQA
jgi:hypothetical protein